jgi:hypothetical protein
MTRLYLLVGSCFRIALAGLVVLAMGGAVTADASLIDPISVERGVSLVMTEQPFIPGDPTNGGVGPLSDSSTATGSFQSSFSESYLAADGYTTSASVSQNSFIGSHQISFYGSTGVVTDDLVGNGNAVIVDQHTILDAVFSLSAASEFEIDFLGEYRCSASGGCTRFFLENLDTGQVIFAGSQTVFSAGIPGDLTGGVNGGDFYEGGSFSSTLDSGTYRFLASGGSHWYTRSREGGPGEALTLDFRLIPEPTTASLLALGLVGIAAMRRRKAA